MTMTLMAGTTLVAQALIMIFLAEAHTRHLPSADIGTVLAASGIGGVLGSVAAGRLPQPAKNFWLRIQMCAWSVALGLLAVFGGSSVMLTALAMIILGSTGAVGNIEFGTYLVRNVTDNMLARVTSIGQVVAIGACALGPMIGGAAIQGYGIEGAILIVFIMVLFLFYISLRAEGTADRRTHHFRVSLIISDLSAMAMFTLLVGRAWRVRRMLRAFRPPQRFPVSADAQREDQFGEPVFARTAALRAASPGV
jgi:predicted MFS family arabinose efflux permease